MRDAVLIPDLGAKAAAGGDVETVFLRPRPDFRCRDGSGFGWARAGAAIAGTAISVPGNSGISPITGLVKPILL